VAAWLKNDMEDLGVFIDGGDDSNSDDDDDSGALDGGMVQH